MHKGVFNGLIDIDKLTEIENYTRIRFKNPQSLRLADTVTIYEQGLFSDERLRELSSFIVGEDLETPYASYIPDKLVNQFYGSNLVPIQFRPSMNEILCAKTPDIPVKDLEVPNINLKIVSTPLYYYLDKYAIFYGEHPEVSAIPAKLKINSIFTEAMSLGASDITLSTKGRSVSIYYNVRKKKVYSRFLLSLDAMKDIIRYLTFESPYDFQSNMPNYVGVQINEDARGRIIVNKKHKGYMLTLRILPNAIFDKSLDDLNISKPAQSFIKNKVMDMENGLRLLVGETMSGKNTTILAILNILNADNKYKIVSVERPVEQELPNIEQINCTSDAEYVANLQSLIRQNPDMVYITEINETTALQVLKETNTGKRVFSTIHANSAADTITRLMDVTQLPIERILAVLHSVIFQKLVRDEEKDILYPVLKCVRFDEEFRYSLLGKSLGEVLRAVKLREEGDVD